MKKRINITMEDWLIKNVDDLSKARGIDRSTALSILVYDQLCNIDMAVSNGEIASHSEALEDGAMVVTDYMRSLRIK